MHRKISTAVLLALSFSPVIGAGVPATDQPAEPDTFFREFIGLKDDQISFKSSQIVEKRTRNVQMELLATG